MKNINFNDALEFQLRYRKDSYHIRNIRSVQSHTQTVRLNLNLIV